MTLQRYYLTSIAIDRSTRAVYTVDAIDRYNPNLFRSDDLGFTWKFVSEVMNFPYDDRYADRQSVVAVSSGALLYGRTVGATSGIYRSTDGGASFGLVCNAVALRIVTHAVEPSLCLAATRDGSWASRDAGASWAPILSAALTTVYQRDIAVAPTDSRVIVVTADSGVLVTHDSGQSWSSSLGGFAITAVDIDAIDSSMLYAAFNGYVAKSTDGGGSWAATQVPTAEQICAIRTDPLGSGSVFIASKWGIYESPDRGVTWLSRNFGLNAGNVYTTNLAIDPVSSATIYALLSDHAIFRTSTGGR